MNPINWPTVTVTCNILNQTPIYSISHLASIVVNEYLSSQSMLTSRDQTETANMASTGGLFGTEKHPEHISELLDNIVRTATANDSRFGK